MKRKPKPLTPLEEECLVELLDERGLNIPKQQLLLKVHQARLTAWARRQP